MNSIDEKGAIKEWLTSKFQEVFRETDQERFVYFAPGRVNLIGEHTDYNGGHVFPCALTLGTYAVVRKRSDNRLRFYSLNFPQSGVIESSLEDLKPYKEAGWTNYPKGILWAFEERGMQISSGMDLLLYGNLPTGAGLSSSASVEILMGNILRDFFEFELDNIELALIGQFSENKFNGMNCGIMDQFAVSMGRKDHAIFLDTADLSYEYAPLSMENASIVIANSNKQHNLVESKYNERRAQCEQALSDLQKFLPIKSLGELSIARYEEYKEVIKDPINRKRARHAVYENQRTLQAVEALKKKDIMTFGQLMNESHVSLRDDYEVTGFEMDTLAQEAWKVQGVIGSRITGGGFGGSTVSIVEKDRIPEFMEKVGEAYKKKVGYAADFYVVKAGDGPKIL